MRYFLSAILFLVCSNLLLAQSWELKKSGDSIKVYTRTAANSPIKEFKATGTLKAKAEEIYNVLRDVSSYPEWIEDVKYAKKLTESDSGMTFYYQIALPWPMKDRDMVLDMKITESDNKILLALDSNNEVVPADKDFIRMLTVNGEWSIEQINNEFCWVEHRFLADPEGSLPAWVVNMFIVDSPYKSMENLANYIKTKQ